MDLDIVLSTLWSAYNIDRMLCYFFYDDNTGIHYNSCKLPGIHKSWLCVNVQNATFSKEEKQKLKSWSVIKFESGGISLEEKDLSFMKITICLARIFAK